jgi:hypothetical protein
MFDNPRVFKGKQAGGPSLYMDPVVGFITVSDAFASEIDRVFLAFGAMEFERGMEFEREELSESSQSRDALPTRRCELAQHTLRRFRAGNNDLGDGLMVLLENAEKVSNERQCEGYYVATAAHLKTLFEKRMQMDACLNDLVAHHQQCHHFCNSQNVQDMMSQIAGLKRTVTAREDELRATRDSIENKMKCLEEQYKARYETRLKLAEEQHKELTERVVTLKAETVELRKRWRAGKSCIAFLNTRLRDVFKRIRAGKAAAEGPKCHVLGTYCDVLGAPV